MEASGGGGGATQAYTAPAMSLHHRRYSPPMIRELTIHTSGQGLHDITSQIAAVVAESGAREGLCTVFIRHTSASLLIQEAADPSARRDLENWLDRHVPENDPHFTHTAEVPDDMPSHIKSALTATSLSIPILNGKLGLGTWQGIYVWEHRVRAHERRVAAGSEDGEPRHRDGGRRLLHRRHHGHGQRHLRAPGTASSGRTPFARLAPTFTTSTGGFE